MSPLELLYYYTSPLKEESNNMQQFLPEKLTKFMIDKVSSDESEKSSYCGFSTLPVKYSKKSNFYFLLMIFISL